jgi:hypothetical protein
LCKDCKPEHKNSDGEHVVSKFKDFEHPEDDEEEEGKAEK